MPAKFSVQKGTSGKFRFVLVAANGENIATSQHYATKAAAVNGAKSVQRSAAGATIEDNTEPKPPVKATPARRVGGNGASKAAAGKSTPSKSAAPAKATKATASKTTASKAPATKAKATAKAAPTKTAKATATATKATAAKATAKKSAPAKTARKTAAKRVG